MMQSTGFNMAVEEGTFYGLPFTIPGLKVGALGTIWSKEIEIQRVLDRVAIPKMGNLTSFDAVFPRRRWADVVHAQRPLYNTPDTNFVMTPHPDYPNVFIAGGFTDMGSNFCSVVGKSCPNPRQGQHAHDISCSGETFETGVST